MSRGRTRKDSPGFLFPEDLFRGVPFPRPLLRNRPDGLGSDGKPFRSVVSGHLGNTNCAERTDGNADRKNENVLHVVYSELGFQGQRRFPFPYVIKDTANP